MGVRKLNPNVIENYRIKKGIKSCEITEKLGLTPGWYSKFKKGQVSLRGVYFLPLSEILGVKPEKLAKEYFSTLKLEDTSNRSAQKGS